jgi:hypothetical protein
MPAFLALRCDCSRSNPSRNPEGHTMFTRNLISISRPGTRTAADAPEVTIRTATAADAPAVRRLAELDERRVPAGPLVLAEVGGEVVAALPVDGGPALADPFRRTAELTPLLALRARQLRGEAGAPRAGRRAGALLAPYLAR